MKEIELNTIMGVISDPIANIYKVSSKKDLDEIEKIVRIFQLADNQSNKHRMFSIKNLATFKLVLSNN